MPRTDRLSSLPLLGLFMFICGILAVESRHALWTQHLGGDLGEFWIRTERYLNGTLEGTEYPPFAVLFFLFVRAWVVKTQVGFVEVFAFWIYVLIALHLAFLNEVGGRYSCLIYGLMMAAAGPILLFRFELLVSFLTLLAWYAWRRGYTKTGGALLSMGILSKLYPLLLVPLMLFPPGRKGDLKKHATQALIGMVMGVVITMTVFCIGGGPISMLKGMVSFHGHKPAGLESTISVVAIGVSYLKGQWPPQSVNEYGIHGLPFPRWARLIVQVLTLTSLGAILAHWWFKRDKDFLIYGQALFFSLIFWSTLFQPQYLLWPLGFTALLPLVGVPLWRAAAMGGLAVFALLTEQVVFPTHYTEFLAIFYQNAPVGNLMVSLAACKLATAAMYALCLYEVFSPAGTETPEQSAEEPEDASTSAPGKRGKGKNRSKA